MKHLVAIAAIVSSALLLPVSAVVAQPAGADVIHGHVTSLSPDTTPDESFWDNVHCTLYTAEEEVGVTCDNPTNEAYRGQLSALCSNKDNPLKSRTVKKDVYIPAGSDTFSDSFTCAAGSLPVWPRFDGPHPAR